MNITAILGIGIVGAILAVTVKNTRPELGLCVAVLTGCIIFAQVIPYAQELLGHISELSEKSGVDFAVFSPLVKIIGIGYITQFSAEIIKDSGENAIAKKVEFAGRIAILMLLVPILENLISAIFKSLALM